MTTDTERQTTKFEETIISIMRRLPSERLPYLVEFARFLEFQAELSSIEVLGDEATESGGDARWDELLARPKAKLLLREMAREARDEYAAGNTTKIGMTDDGRLKPE